MKTLIPSNFMAVAHKYSAHFSYSDAELSTGANLLYKILFEFAGQKDHCWPSQVTLAKMCHCSCRTVQAHIRQLIHLKYIQVERHGTINVYRLLLSPRIEQLIDSLGTSPYQTRAVNNTIAHTKSANFSPSYTQILPSKGANFAHELRSKNKKQTQSTSQAFPSPVSVTMGVSSFPPRKEAKNHSTITADFERLFSAWPVKQDKLACSKAYAQLAKQHRAPVLEVILAAIERMKSHDRRWKAGYVPNLKFWLLGERWHDEPIADERTSPLQSTQSSCSHALKICPPPRAEGKMPRQPVVRPTSNTPLTSTGDDVNRTVLALQQLWPSLQRNQFFASIGLARCRGVTASQLAECATEYFGTLNGKTPMPLRDWVRSYANA